MSIISLSCNAVKYSYTPDTTLVLHGDSTLLSSITVVWHADGVANTGLYIKPTTTIRVSHAEFNAIVAAFNDGSAYGVCLSYESTLKKNNVTQFTGPGINIVFSYSTSSAINATA